MPYLLLALNRTEPNRTERSWAHRSQTGESKRKHPSITRPTNPSTVQTKTKERPINQSMNPQIFIQKKRDRIHKIGLGIIIYFVDSDWGRRNERAAQSMNLSTNEASTHQSSTTIH